MSKLGLIKVRAVDLRCPPVVMQDKIKFEEETLRPPLLWQDFGLEIIHEAM
jgi:hypothetical protein